MLFVYFAQSRPGAPIKIGVSACPAMRAWQIRCPLTGERPRVLATVVGDRKLEREIQSRFASRRTSGVGAEGIYSPAGLATPSEWFVPCPELLDLIAEHRA